MMKVDVNKVVEDQLSIEDEVLCYVTFHGPSEVGDIETYGLSNASRDANIDLAPILATLVSNAWLGIDNDDHGNGYVVRRYVMGVAMPQDNPGVWKAQRWLAQEAKERDCFDDCVIRILHNCPKGTTIERLIVLLGGEVSWSDTSKSIDRLTSMYSTRLPIVANGKHVALAR
jgi:hypothetical protein